MLFSAGWVVLLTSELERDATPLLMSEEIDEGYLLPLVVKELSPRSSLWVEYVSPLLKSNPSLSVLSVDLFFRSTATTNISSGCADTILVITQACRSCPLTGLGSMSSHSKGLNGR